MLPQAVGTIPAYEVLPRLAPAEECKIRWERQPDNDQQLVIVDAVTGQTLAVVRSLFDIRPQ